LLRHIVVALGVEIVEGLEFMGLVEMRFAMKKLRWVIVLGTLFTTLLFAIAWYGPQFVLYFKIRRGLPYVDSFAHLSTTPQPLTESGASATKGTVLSYFGCSFEVPWQETVLERNDGRWAEVQFKTGQTVRVFNPAEFYVHDFISSYAAGGLSMWEMASKAGFPKSKYEQFKAVLSATPAQLSPFQSRQQFARTMVLINQKGVYFEHNPFKPEIFSFERPDLRGFEISGISQNMEEATLAIFDATDKMFTVRIRGNRGLNTNLNQSEINRVIDSFSVENDLPSRRSQKR
jgi:hypothetical protein